MTDEKIYLVGANRRITLRDAKPGDKYIQRICHDGTITLLPITFQLAAQWKVDKSPSEKEHGEIETTYKITKV